MRWTPEQFAALQARRAPKQEPAKGTAAAREADLHREIIAECERRGWHYFRSSMAHRTHRTVGEPDFIICSDKGVVLFVECKSRTGKLSAEQQACHRWLAKLGHTVHVVRSMEEFLEITKP
jgi:hypothetical protein